MNVTRIGTPYLFVVLGMLALADCTKPYDRPVVEEPPLPMAATFPGFKDFFSDTAPLRVFWTHGMCTHKLTWVENRSTILATALGVKDTSAATPPASPPGRPYTVSRSFNAPGGTVEVSFFVWSPMTTPYKDTLRFDAPPTKDEPPPGGKFPHDRASLNNALKVGLMNDCLTDAVVYSGSNGEPIRVAMREAVCAALGGTLRPPADCELSDARAAGPMVFVTESLGSKFLFDAVRAIWDAAGAKSPTAQGVLAARLAEVQMLYMLANQIPILDQANPVGGFGPTAAGEATAPDRSSLAGFARIISAARREAPEEAAIAVPSGEVLKPLTVVGFSDPNDILSYRLLPSGLGVEGARLVNVLVSNDWTYLGLVELPDVAHCGYGQNPHVIGLLVEGYDGPGTMPTGPVAPGGACDR